MLQHLLNTSAIWLISLFLFDVFLRRESYHGYNRFYLLFTFLLGAVLPLLQFNKVEKLYGERLSQPLHEVIRVKQTIVAASVPVSNSISGEEWLLAIYLLGALVVFAILVVDIAKVANYYRRGSKTTTDGWAIVYTGKEHAPFSMLNVLFVSSKNQYSPAEWEMILVHEKRHATLLHFIDLLLMQVSRIVLWFHPLVYIYNNRLLLVHEYQADDASAAQPKVYGTFLVEQALLQGAPIITHSLNRSPIKKRILMLTRKSNKAARTKMLVFVPLAMVCVTCFTKSSLSKKFKKKGDQVTYRGNTIELSKPVTDTVSREKVADSFAIQQVIVTPRKPVKLNGEAIPQNVDKGPVFTGSEGNLRAYIINNAKAELAALDDGMYALDISNILIDEKGEVAYFNFEDVKRSRRQEEIITIKPAQVEVSKKPDPEITVTITSGPQAGTTGRLLRNTGEKYFAAIPQENQDAIHKRVNQLMKDAPRFTPGTIGGKKVTATYQCPQFWNHFKVEQHKLYELSGIDNWVEVK
jgi:hypothetical protein